MSFNRLELSGHIANMAEIRYTPAGIPVLSFHLQHVSEQVEAGMKRRIECDVPSVVMGPLALKAQHFEVASQVRVTGFLTKRSLKSTQLVLHIQTLEKII